MTKEQLEKEAEENSKKAFCIAHTYEDELIFKKGYLAGAEPRENRIADLETRCTELFLQNNKFAERFEKSIEIIKGLLSCCRNYPQENADKMKQAEQFLQENEDDLKEGCPDVLCEDCTKEDCTVRKLGLVPNKEIEK